jgi:hypothetical protein
MRRIWFVLGVFLVTGGFDSADAAPPSARSDIVAIADATGDGVQELAILEPLLPPIGSAVVPGSGSSLYVLEPSDGRIFTQVLLEDADWSSLSLAGVSMEETSLIAVLQQHISGAVRVKVFDAESGESISDLTFLDTSRTAQQVAFVPSADEFGEPGLAVLARNMPIDDRGHSYLAGEEVIVEVRSLDGNLLHHLYFQYYSKWGYGYDVIPVDLLVMEDQTLNACSEIAVLGLVELADDIRYSAVVAQDACNEQYISPTSGSDGSPRLRFFGDHVSPVSLAAIEDANLNGEFEVAVLVRRDDGRSRVQSRGILSRKPVIRAAGFGKDFEGQFVRGLNDIDGQGTVGVAVAGFRRNGSIAVFVRDGVGHTATLSLNLLDGVYELFGFTTLKDYTGNGVDELVLLSRNEFSGQSRVQILDASTGILSADVALNSGALRP